MNNKCLSITSKMSSDFNHFFGFSVNMVFNAFKGFDIYKFDRLINVPDEESMAEYIERNYSKEAVILIKRFLDL